MTDAVKSLARELADAIAAAVAQDPRVAHCRKRAQAQGYEMQLTLEAIIGFSDIASADADQDHPEAPRPIRMTAQDRRFLRSLRIAADQTMEERE